MYSDTQLEMESREVYNDVPACGKTPALLAGHSKLCFRQADAASRPSPSEPYIRSGGEIKDEVITRPRERMPAASRSE